MPRVSSEAVERNRVASRERAARNRSLNRKRQKEARDRKREEKPFIGWDGEGYRTFSVDSNGLCTVQHHYMLFGASTGHYVHSKDLSTKECLDTILHVESLNPDAIHVGISFEYDVNMILKDLPWRMLAVLSVCNRVRWNGYHIRHTPHKMFSVRKNDISATIYDAFGFFHCSYMSALKKYGVGTEKQLKKIESGKNMRSYFTWRNFTEVLSYWLEEISLFPPLMDEVRAAVFGGGFFISEWHGPGALASYALKHYKVFQLKSRDLPLEVKYAIQSAYAGGRFQLWRCGLYLRNIYTADINSAYIYACSLMPNLAKGYWKRVDPNLIDRADIPRFGLFRIAFDAGREWEATARRKGIPAPPFPLFHRDKNGRLTWPSRVEGWYWSPEARLVADSSSAQFLEAWIFYDDGSYPFKWVHDGYSKRLELQVAGNPAEKAIKWALAAIYGAFARRVGWNKKTRMPPASHELAFAGFITSWCRAAVYDAAAYAASLGGLVSIDTDGITSTVPFDESVLVNGVGRELGQWKLEQFSSILSWQNGIYWLKNDEGKWEDPKTRGIPKGSVPIDLAMNAYLSADWKNECTTPSIDLFRTKFIGYREALQGRFDEWRHWVTRKETILLGGAGKGRHVPQLCGVCYPRPNLPVSFMHTVTHFPPSHVDSQPHKLPWLEDIETLPDKAMYIWGDDDIAA